MPEAKQQAQSKASSNKRGLLRSILPDSLAGQLFSIFTFCFFLFLALGVINNALTRQEFHLRGMMVARAWRVADLSLLLDAAPVSERQWAAERMSSQDMLLQVVSAPPSLSGLTPDNLIPFAEAYREEINLALQEARQPTLNRQSRLTIIQSPTPDQGQNNLRMRISERSPVSLEARVAVRAVNPPSVWDDIKTLFRIRRSDAAMQSEPVYNAVLVIPLSDVNWLVVEDNPSALRYMGRIPLAGVIATEAFFLVVSLLALLLVVRPLRRLIKGTENFGRDIIGSPPVPESGPREIREAAQAFNAMQSQVRHAVEERARTLAAVSHDLRTPLTRMRLRVEQAPDSLRLPLQKDIDELQQFMDMSIDLAGASGAEGKARLDIASLLESLVEDYQELGHNVRFVHTERLLNLHPLMARPLSIKRCLTNVLENAIRYGGGEVRVSVQDSRDDLRIYVRDNGPGIAKADQERVFENFYRLEPSRNRETGGSGLGLSIARTMARAHGGDIVLSNRPEGGLQVEIILPRTVPESNQQEQTNGFWKNWLNRLRKH